MGTENLIFSAESICRNLTPEDILLVMSKVQLPPSHPLFVKQHAVRALHREAECSGVKFSDDGIMHYRV